VPEVIQNIKTQEEHHKTRRFIKEYEDVLKELYLNRSAITCLTALRENLLRFLPGLTSLAGLGRGKHNHNEQIAIEASTQGLRRINFLFLTFTVSTGATHARV